MMGRGKGFETSNPSKRQTPPNESSLSFIPTQVLLGKPVPEASSTQAKAPELSARSIGYTRRKKKDKYLQLAADKAKTDDKGTTKEDWSPSMDGITGELPPSLAFWMKRNALRSTNGGESKSRFIMEEDNNNKDGVKETENEMVEKVLYGSGRSSLPVFEELCRVKDKDEAMSKVKDKDEGKSKEEDNDYVIV